MGGPEELWAALVGTRIVAGSRKYHEFALASGDLSGEGRICFGTLGFRSRSAEDARALARFYKEQVRERIAAEFGLSIRIEFS